MKLKKYLLIIAAFLLVTALFTYSNEDDYPTMDNTIFENPQRTAAIFDHDEHNEMAELEDNCTLCHHVYEDGKLIEDESSEENSCSDCHGMKSSTDNEITLKSAFHKRCRQCHFDVKKGPVLCGECHKK